MTAWMDIVLSILLSDVKFLQGVAKIMNQRKPTGWSNEEMITFEKNYCSVETESNLLSSWKKKIMAITKKRKEGLEPYNEGAWNNFDGPWCFVSSKAYKMDIS